MRRAGVLCLALAAAGCGSEEKTAQTVVVENPRLSGVSGCESLKSEIETRAIREMNAEIDALLDSIEKGGGNGFGFGGDVATSAPAPSPTPAPRESASEFTTTNTQEKDVDEPDFVKNDGSRILALQGRKLLHLSAWPPGAARMEWDTNIEGQPISMLLHGNKVTVFSSVWLPQLGTPPAPSRIAASILPYSIGNAVKVTVLDIGEGNPRTLDEQYIEGSFLTARRTGSSVRVISVTPKRGPELSYWPEGDVPWSSRSAARSAMEKLRKENEKRIKASRLEDWLPRAFVRSGGSLSPVSPTCQAFCAANVPSRLAFTTVSTLDLSTLQTRRSTLLSQTDEAYASKSALFLTARHDFTNHPSQTDVHEDHTYVFEFDISSDPKQTRGLAAGGVPGHIVNSFAMDEEEGFLRIATTRETRLGWRLMSSTNGVFVLRRSGERLARVGEITGIARGERIYSARFEGKRGYVVTFRNIDPLFTLDLSDPASPRVAGELKVPGYSTYIHTMGTSHLLTIGREVSEDGRMMGGVALQIFDVSNFAAPLLAHRLALGSRWSSSEAEYDHKAFTYFPSRGLLTLPFSDWSPQRQEGFTSGLEVLRATTDGLSSLGAVDHRDLYVGRAADPWGFQPSVRRSILMEDYVWSISDAGAKLHDTRNLTRAVQSIPFPPPEASTY